MKQFIAKLLLLAVLFVGVGLQPSSAQQKKVVTKKTVTVKKSTPSRAVKSGGMHKGHIVYVGPNGGKYIIVKGKKEYIK